MAAQADLAETKLAKQRGTLLDADDVEREWYDVPRIARAGILATHVGLYLIAKHSVGIV